MSSFSRHERIIIFCNSTAGFWFIVEVSRHVGMATMRRVSGQNVVRLRGS